MLEEWRPLQNSLEQLFVERHNESILQQMNKGIQVFMYALYIANQQSLTNAPIEEWGDVSDGFYVTPINLKERLLFVMENRTIHHAYIQLNQLYSELLKKYAVHKAKNKSHRE